MSGPGLPEEDAKKIWSAKDRSSNRSFASNPSVAGHIVKSENL